LKLLRIGGGGVVEEDGGGELTKMYCKHFCKCHDEPSIQRSYDKNKVKKTKIDAEQRKSKIQTKRK
jgi:hypothetical protein